MKTKIKLCGLSRPEDIETANELEPTYIGFVFAPSSRRYVPPEAAAELKKMLFPTIQAVGVFVREEADTVAGLLNCGIIDAAQLHGGEDEAYVTRLRALTDKPILKAFRVETESDLASAAETLADFPLLDSGTGGTGIPFDWRLLNRFRRPYFLAGGLTVENAARAVETLHPYAMDVSSGIETNGRKDPIKMREFVRAVKNAEGKEKEP